MKNKFKKLIFLLFINFLVTSHLFSEEINFEANFIELIDEEKKIIAKKNIKISIKKRSSMQMKWTTTN